MSERKKRILVLCTGNSARSQMAEGLLKKMFGTEFEVYSAGVDPTHVRPEAVIVMADIGIDISGNRSKSVEEFADQEIDYVLTVCDNAKENCPYFPAGVRLVHHQFEDPADISGGEEERLRAFRRVREEMDTYLRDDFAKNVLGL